MVNRREFIKGTLVAGVTMASGINLTDEDTIEDNQSDLAPMRVEIDELRRKTNTIIEYGTKNERNGKTIQHSCYPRGDLSELPDNKIEETLKRLQEQAISHDRWHWDFSTMYI